MYIALFAGSTLLSFLGYLFLKGNAYCMEPNIMWLIYGLLVSGGLLGGIGTARAYYNHQIVKLQDTLLYGE